MTDLTSVHNLHDLCLYNGLHLFKKYISPCWELRTELNEVSFKSYKYIGDRDLCIISFWIINCGKSHVSDIWYFLKHFRHLRVSKKYFSHILLTCLYLFKGQTVLCSIKYIIFSCLLWIFLSTTVTKSFCVLGKFDSWWNKPSSVGKKA